MQLTSYYTTLLTATFSSSSTQQTKKAQQQLKLQFKNQLFFETMQSILLGSPKQEIKLATILILRQYSYHLIITHNQVSLGKYSNHIIKLFRSSNLSLKLLTELSDSLKFVITKDPMHNIRLEAVKRIISQYKQLQESDYSGTKQDYLYLILLTRSLIIFPYYDSLNNDLVKASFNILVKSNIKIFGLLNQQPTQDLVNICYLLSQLFPLYFNRTDIRQNQVIQDILWSQQLDKLFMIQLKYTFQTLGGVYSSQQNVFNVTLMKIQANTLHFIELIIRQRHNKAQNDKLNIQLLNLTPVFIQSINHAISHSIEVISQSPQALITLTHIIRLFETLVRYQSHFQYFQSNLSIYEQSIFPLLQIPSSLKQAFLEKPQLFVSFYNYVFDSSMFDDKDITDHLLGLMTSVSQFLIMSIQFVGILNKIVNFSLNILTGINSNFNQNRIVSYNVSSKSDILNKVKIYLQMSIEFCSQIKTNNDEQILQVLNMMIISKYTTPLDNSIFSSKVLQLVLRVIEQNNSQPHRVLALQLLSILIRMQSNFKNSADKLVGYLINMTNNPNQAVRVLGLLSDLYGQNQYLKYNYELSLKVVKYFIYKIKKYQTDKQSITKTLNRKCWNIINQIVEVDTKKPQNFQFLRAVQMQVSNLYYTLTTKNDSLIQQQIINFNISLISRTQHISKLQSDIVLCLPNLLQNYNYNIEFIYQFLILFIRYGEMIIENSTQHQQILFAQCIKCCKVIQQPKAKQSSIVKGVVLLEVLLLYCQNLESKSWLMAIRQIYKLSNLSHIYYTFLKANFVGFLSLSLALYPTFGDQILVNSLIAKVLSESYCIDTDFASKTYVLSLCWLLRGSAKSPLVKAYENSKIVSSIAHVLSFSLKNKNPNLDEQQQQYMQNVKMLFKNIPQIDQIQLFKTIMLQYKRQNNQGFKQLINKLNQKQKKQLSSLLIIQFIHSEPRQIASVRRKQKN